MSKWLMNLASSSTRRAFLIVFLLVPGCGARTAAERCRIRNGFAYTGNATALAVANQECAALEAEDRQRAEGNRVRGEQAMTDLREREMTRARAPRWPDLDAGVAEARSVCTQQGATFRNTPYGFACELRLARKTLFAGVLDQGRTTIRRLDAYIADGSLERVREQTIERYGEPTSVERDAQGMRVWRWLVPSAGNIVSLSLTSSSLRIGFVRADDALASELAPIVP